MYSIINQLFLWKFPGSREMDDIFLFSREVKNGQIRETIIDATIAWELTLTHHYRYNKTITPLQSTVSLPHHYILSYSNGTIAASTGLLVGYTTVPTHNRLLALIVHICEAVCIVNCKLNLSPRMLISPNYDISVPAHNRRWFHWHPSHNTLRAATEYCTIHLSWNLYASFHKETFKFKSTVTLYAGVYCRTNIYYHCDNMFLV